MVRKISWKFGWNPTYSISPIRNPQCPPSPQHILYQPNLVRSWSNFQDRPDTIYQLDLWCQMWPHSPCLQSGTLKVLQAPNFGFLSQIMSDLDQIFRIGPLATTIIIFDVQLDPILQVSSQEWSTSSKPPCNKKTILKQVFSWAEPDFLSIKTC